MSNRRRFEALVHAHHAAVHRSAFRVLRRSDAAQDATQEVFLRVLDGRIVVPAGDEGEERRVLAWWAIRVAWNAARSDARRLAREERHAMERTPDADSPEADDRRLWRLVDELSDDLRIPLVMRFVEGITFERIGAALGVGESAAHERVAKAVGRLRERLGSVGLGALGAHVAGLEGLLAERLPRAAATDPAASVPAELTARLLALQAGATALHGGVVLALVAAGALGVGVAALALRGGDRPATVPAVVAASADAGDGVVSPPTPEDPTPTDVRVAAPLDSADIPELGTTQDTPPPPLRGRVAGRVVDGDGGPVAGAEVSVESIERDGKFAAHGATTRADVNGRFEVEVDVADAGGGLYTAYVQGPNQRGEGAPPARLLPSARIDLGEVVAPPPVGDPPTVAGAGNAPAGSVSGTLSVAEVLADRPLTEQVSVHVRVGPRGDWVQGEVEADGRFTVRDLPLGVHRVLISPMYHTRRHGEEVGYSPTWLDVELTAERQASTGHDLLLKREDEPRDVGHHAAELHGRVVRRSDGAAVAVDCWALEVDVAPELDELTFRRDWLPNHVFPAPVQRSMAGPVPPATERFHLTGLEGGRYLVRCNTEGYAALVHGPLELAPREVRGELVLALEAPCSAGGQVLGPDGAPVEGALVFVTGVGEQSEALVLRADSDVRAADGRGYVHVNSSQCRTQLGAFEIDALPSGVGFRMVAVHPDHEPVSGPVFELAPGEARRGEVLRFGPPRAR